MKLKNVARIFVAIPVPYLQAEEFKIIQQQNLSLSNIRWTPLANLHVTIFFLGEVLEENIFSINNAIKKVIENTSPFRIDFEKIMLKGQKKNNGMIWAKFFRNDSYASLSNAIYNAVKEFLIVQPVFKEPVPHITLARIKNMTGIDAINLSFKENFSLLEINSCELWKTVHTKDGVVYECLEQFDFRK